MSFVGSPFTATRSANSPVFTRADAILPVEHLGVVHRRGAQRLQRREPVGHEPFDFACALSPCASGPESAPLQIVTPASSAT